MTDMLITPATAMSMNPFEESPGHVKECWRLGYHDGLKSVTEGAGEEAALAFAVSDHHDSIRETTSYLAKLRGSLEVAHQNWQRLTDELEASHRQLLPSFGVYQVGLVPNLVAVLYVMLAVVSVCAEVPLSALTVGESLGGLSSEVLGTIKSSSMYGLVLMLCLLGFSVKLLADVLDQAKSHAWWEKGLVLVTLACSVMSIYGVAQLRGAIAQAEIAITTGLPKEAIDKATAAIPQWSAFTFWWVTITLPIFASVCLVLGLHQLRNYRRHNRAILMAGTVARERNLAIESRSTLEAQLMSAEARLASLEGEDTSGALFRDRTLHIYRHGVSTGSTDREAQLDSLGIYHRMLLRFSHGL